MLKNDLEQTLDQFAHLEQVSEVFDAIDVIVASTKSFSWFPSESVGFFISNILIFKSEFVSM